MSLIKFVLPILMVTTVVHATTTTTTSGSFVFNGVTKFISADVCKTYYASLVTPVAGQTATTYCADKIMTLLEACTATNIAQYLSSNNIANFTDLTNTDQINVKSKYQYQCQVNAQKDTAATTAQKAAASSASSSTTGAGLAATAAGVAAVAAATSGTNNSVQTAQAVNQLTQQVVKSAETIDSANAQKVASQIPLATDQNGNVITTGTMGAVNKALDSANSSLADGSAAATSSTASTGGIAAIAAPSNPNSYSTSSSNMATDTGASSNPNVYSTSGSNMVADNSAATISPAAQQQAASATTAAKAEMGSATTDASQVSPDLSNSLSDVSSKSDSSSISPPVTELTATSKTADGSLQSGITAANAATTQLAAGGMTPPFSNTITLLNKYQASIKAYIAKKEATCTSAAEKASFLCMDSSPAMQATKQLLSAATPILSLISSAQKNCSSTAKVTKVVNLGLTIAEGVCIAAKVTCDTLCGTSSATITELTTTFSSEYPGAVAMDQIAGTQACAAVTASTYGSGTAACEAELAKKTAASQTANTQYKAVLTKENGVAPGTSSALVAKCSSLAKDIALLGVQVLGTYTALQSAKACETKLASSGGGAITTQQYCEKAENISQQVCICQKTPTATGCPGAIAANTPTTPNGADKGANIQSTGGNSGFGGAFKPVGPTPALNFGKGSGSTNGASTTGAADSSANNGLAGSGSGAGGGGSSEGGGLAAPGGSSLGAADAAKNGLTKKDFNFGGYGGAGGGSGGFGGYGGAGASSGGVSMKSGALTSRDQDAIRRQIASEQLSAEVSTASGKSNWEKVRSMYLNKENSFFGQ